MAPANSTVPAAECEERDKLRKAHRDAIESWTKAGGLDPTKRGLPHVTALEKAVEDTMVQIVVHRNRHGC